MNCKFTSFELNEVGIKNISVRISGGGQAQGKEHLDRVCCFPGQ